jgi:hypothetical protein
MSAGDSPDFIGKSVINNQYVPTAQTVHMGSKTITVTSLDSDVGYVYPDTDILTVPVAINGIFCVVSVSADIIDHFDISSTDLGMTSPNGSWFGIAVPGMASTYYPSVGLNYSVDDRSYGDKEVLFAGVRVAQSPRCYVVCHAGTLSSPVTLTVDFFGIVGNGPGIPTSVSIDSGNGSSPFTPVWTSKASTVEGFFKSSKWVVGDGTPFNICPSGARLSWLNVCDTFVVPAGHEGWVADLLFSINGYELGTFHSAQETITSIEFNGTINKTFDFGTVFSTSDIILLDANQATSVTFSWVEM